MRHHDRQPRCRIGRASSVAPVGARPARRRWCGRRRCRGRPRGVPRRGTGATSLVGSSVVTTQEESHDRRHTHRRCSAHGRARARRLCRRLELERRHRAAASAGVAVIGAGQSAARHHARLRLHRQPHQPDPRPGAGRRPLLWRRGHQQRRHQRQERRRPGLRRRLRPGRGRGPGAVDGHLEGQRPRHRPWYRSSTRPARATRPRWSS